MGIQDGSGGGTTGEGAAERTRPRSRTRSVPDRQTLVALRYRRARRGPISRVNVPPAEPTQARVRRTIPSAYVQRHLRCYRVSSPPSSLRRTLSKVAVEILLRHFFYANIFPCQTRQEISAVDERSDVSFSAELYQF